MNMTTYDVFTRRPSCARSPVRVVAVAVVGLATTLVACQDAAAPHGNAKTTSTVAGTAPSIGAQFPGGNAFTGAHYVSTGALPDLDRTGQLYRIPTTTGLRSIASAFAVLGPVVSEGTGSVIDDHTRRVSLAGGQWSETLSLSPPAGSPLAGSPTSGCVAPSASTKVRGTCVTPSQALPADELSAEKKRSIGNTVREVLRRAGVDVGAVIPRVTGRHDAWSATVSPMVAGLPTVGLESVVSGSGDKVELGHGSLTSLTKAATKSLIGVPAGVEQLNRGLLLGSLGAGDAAPNGPTSGVRRIVSVRMVLAYLPTSGSDVVPAYQFSLADGGTVTTPAVLSAGPGSG